MKERNIDKAVNYIQDSIHDFSLKIEYEQNEKEKINTSELIDSLENLLVFIEENRR